MSLDWTLIRQDTLNSVDLDALVQNVDRFDCTTFGSEVSRVEREEGRWTPEQRECLRFVGAVLTMMLRPDQPAEPYGPMFVIDGQRSAIPTDFDKQGLLGTEAWALSLRDPELRARFLDVLWVQARAFRAAKGAVEAYIASALRLEHPQEWTSGHKRLERALRLAASLGRGGADLRQLVLAEAEAMLHRHRGTDPLYLTMRLIRLLLEFKHGDAKQFSEYAMVAATTAEAAQNFWRAKDYYQLVAECKRAAGDMDGEAAALRCSAESLVKEAELARKQPGRGAMAAASILSDAVEAMRRAPDGRERAAELHEQLIGIQKESLAELSEFSTSMDVSELVQRALNSVRDKSLKEAVFALCAMARPPSIERLKRDAHEQARISVIGSLMSSQVLNSRGQVVAIAPGLEAGDDDPKQEGLRWRMFRLARVHRNLTVQAMLNPARTEIYGAHSPDRQDVAGLIQHSPWIPPGHAESVMRALVAGFQGDMIIAGHLVPPQFEAMVRHVVESHGGTTSKLEPGGVQPERSLGQLLDTPEALHAFGEDGVFELQDLFTEQLGTNLRNEVAHGLLDDSGLFEADVLYAWWLLLRYFVVTSKMVQQREQEPGANGTAANSDANGKSKSI
ncbi:TPA: DUF4209 domain-containing protein [Burkholderia vietnamiensis]|nr:DUF4209 domain-containing protein [Burkholderia vietnamiensis]HDR9231694.1 DUF4209 domain-containing protein [Burkholderia vietnamiensis]